MTLGTRLAVRALREVGVVGVEAAVLEPVGVSFAYKPMPRPSWRR